MVAATQSRRSSRQAGFTLIELMVTLVIASILVGIAVPSYTSHVRKSRRTDARTALLDLASREERYFSLNSTYTASAKNLGYSTNDVPLSMNTTNGYYTLSVSNVNAATTTASATFLATAVPAGTQTNDTSCQSFTLDQSGAQTAKDGGGNDTTSTCWN